MIERADSSGKKSAKQFSLYYNISHTLLISNHPNRVKLKMKMLRKGDVDLPGALDAMFNTKNDRGALWVRTGYCTTYITVNSLFGSFRNSEKL